MQEGTSNTLDQILDTVKMNDRPQTAPIRPATGQLEDAQPVSFLTSLQKTLANLPPLPYLFV